MVFSFGRYLGFLQIQYVESQKGVDGIPKILTYKGMGPHRRWSRSMIAALGLIFR